MLVSRKYMRGKPGVTERIVGACILGLLAMIVGTFLLTGGLFSDTVNRISILRGVKDFVGISERPLFEAAPEHIKLAAPPREMRVADSMLPELSGRWQRLGVTAFPVRRGQTRALAVKAAQSLSCERQTSDERPPAEELINALESFDARWVYQALYQDREGDATAHGEYQALVTVVDAGEPAAAFGLWRTREPDAATPMELGCGGWIVDAPARCGFRAGRYYTEVQGSAPGGGAAALARAIAGVQLVYGGPFPAESVPPAGQASATADAPATRPAAGTAGRARFAAVPGSDLVTPTTLERYTDNLYEKINGKEAMFRAYLFVELRFGRYLDPRRQEAYDVYLFDMGEPVNAFGIYMAERSREVEVLQIGRDAYISGTNVYFFKNKYYVNVLGPVQGDERAAETAKRIAAAIAETIADSGERFWAQDLLPAQDRVAHSLSYLASSAMGYDFLNRMFQAGYETSGTSYQMYLIKAADAQGARELFNKFAEATARYDKVVSREAYEGGAMLVSESLGVYGVAFHAGRFFGGVAECEDQALAVKRANELRDRLGRAIHGKINHQGTKAPSAKN